MFFICNNSLLFDPEAHAISIVGQPESVLTLSAPAVRLLQEFIRHKGRDLSREELITRVWEEFGFTPSGNNLNKAVSELRKSFHALGDSHDYIVTVPRFGFRFDADVIFKPAESVTPEVSQPSVEQLSKLAELLKKNNVACEREEYNIYYFSARFSLAAADEVFIGACPVSEASLCKTIRYKSGAEE